MGGRREAWPPASPAAALRLSQTQDTGCQPDTPAPTKQGLSLTDGGKMGMKMVQGRQRRDTGLPGKLRSLRRPGGEGGTGWTVESPGAIEPRAGPGPQV